MLRRFGGRRGLLGRRGGRILFMSVVKSRLKGVGVGLAGWAY